MRRFGFFSTLKLFFLKRQPRSIFIAVAFASFAAAFIVFVVLPLARVPGHLAASRHWRTPRVLDRHSQVLRTGTNSRDEKVIATKLSEIPLTIQHAFILAEDRRFYSHYGIDAKALLRASWQLISRGKIISGASTIPMQLARLEWPELSRPFHKPAQMIQAVRLHFVHTTAEILEAYLNQVPFARQVAGVEQGCLYFFAKTCDRISLAEAATLAVFPRNPARYLRDRPALKQARDRLLGQLASSLKISVTDLLQAQLEPIQLKMIHPKVSAYHVSQRLKDVNSIERRGVLRTTLDSHLQKEIEKILYENVKTHPHLGDTGAVLVVDNRSSEVVAYVGSPNFFNADHGMVDGVTSLRSPGSALKPFVYAYALEQGWTLSSVLPDVPMQFKVQNGVFSPTNYGGDFSGPRLVRDALANSKNIPALYLTAQLGESSVLNFLRQAGFTSLSQSSDHYGVGLAIGNGEVSLWELTQSYSALARNGEFRPVTFLRAPNTRESETTSPRRIMSPETASLITNVLSDPQARAEEFGRGGPLEFDFAVAVKTGTSSSYRDHWAVGYTRDYTVGVWKGNSNGRPLTSHVPAARGAGRVFHAVISYLHARQIPRPFSTEGLSPVRVCALSGQLASDFCPSSRMELFSGASAPDHECTYHKRTVIRACAGGSRTIDYVDLPKTFEAWAETSRLPTLSRQIQDVCGRAVLEHDGFAAVADTDADSATRTASRLSPPPRIVEPFNDAIYAIDPTIPRSHQKLRLTFSGTTHSAAVTLYINGRLVRDVRGLRELDWDLTEGVHEFELRVASASGEKSQTAEKVKIRVF